MFGASLACRLDALHDTSRRRRLPGGLLPAPNITRRIRPRRDGMLLGDHGPVQPADRRGVVLHASLRVLRSLGLQGGCCSSPATSGPVLAVVGEGCWSVGPAAVVDEALHARLADLPRRYDVNDYAASVKVFAVKPLD